MIIKLIKEEVKQIPNRKFEIIERISVNQFRKGIVDQQIDLVCGNKNEKCDVPNYRWIRKRIMKFEELYWDYISDVC